MARRWPSCRRRRLTPEAQSWCRRSSCWGRWGRRVCMRRPHWRGSFRIGSLPKRRTGKKHQPGLGCTRRWVVAMGSAGRRRRESLRRLKTCRLLPGSHSYRHYSLPHLRLRLRCRPVRRVCTCWGFPRSRRLRLAFRRRSLRHTQWSVTPRPRIRRALTSELVGKHTMSPE